MCNDIDKNCINLDENGTELQSVNITYSIDKKSNDINNGNVLKNVFRRKGNGYHVLICQYKQINLRIILLLKENQIILEGNVMNMKMCLN